STAKDTWLLGAGPFQQGTIRKGTEFAGEPLPIPTFAFKGTTPDDAAPPPRVTLTTAASWPEEPASATSPYRLASFNDISTLPTGAEPRKAPNWEMPWNLPRTGEPGASHGPTVPKGKPEPTSTSNAGGQAETEPCRIVAGGLGVSKPGATNETEPSKGVNTATGFKPDF